MTSIVNTAQSEAWNGYEGTHWASNADRYDAVNSGFNRPLLDAVAIGPGDRVLDVGCGNGQLTRLAAAAADPGRVLGIDLSEPMLATARARASTSTASTSTAATSTAATSTAATSNIEFVRGDAQVYPFPDDSLDVVLSRFGVMFFADPVAAFANLNRALRPGGRLAFVCMRELAGTDLGAVFGALIGQLPGGEQPTGADGTGPTSFADPARIRGVLTEAGFEDVRWEQVEADQVWGRDVADAAAFIAAWGPVRHWLSQVDPATAATATAALIEALRPYEQGGAVRLRGKAWLVTAAAR
jgi:SAM-dependent methyltransferase